MILVGDKFDENSGSLKANPALI